MLTAPAPAPADRELIFDIMAAAYVAGYAAESGEDAAHLDRLARNACRFARAYLEHRGRSLAAIAEGPVPVPEDSSCL